MNFFRHVSNTFDELFFKYSRVILIYQCQFRDTEKTIIEKTVFDGISNLDRLPSLNLF